MIPFKLIETATEKILRSKSANYNFSKVNGDMITWGNKFEDEVLFSEVGPFILDLEVTTICNHECNFCYKQNSKIGKNMSLENFKKILDKVNSTKVLTQIAIGADSNLKSNPEVFDMMEYARDSGVIPNVTVANISEDVADKLSKVCGAVAISRYSKKDECYDSVKRLTDRELKQTNIHMLLSKETTDQVWKLLNDVKTDKRLEKLNAIVFLTLKKKGRGVNHNILEKEEYEKIVNYCLENNIQIGFDSCGVGKFLESVKEHPSYEKYLTMVQPCESTRESFYIDVDGKAFPCSFCPNTDSFSEGLDVLNCENFVDDIWNNPRTIQWRENLLNQRTSGNFNCPVFEV